MSPKLVDMREGNAPGTGKDETGKILGPHAQNFLNVGDEYIDGAGKKHRIVSKEIKLGGETITVAVSV